MAYNLLPGDLIGANINIKAVEESMDFETLKYTALDMLKHEDPNVSWNKVMGINALNTEVQDTYFTAEEWIA